MKFQPNDVVRRVLPSGTMVGVLMIVIARARGKRTVVKDVSTGECYIYKFVEQSIKMLQELK